MGDADLNLGWSVALIGGIVVLSFMNQLIPLLLPLLAGVALGGFYFGSLWWVVRRVTTMRHPQLCLLVSFLVRTAITLAGFFVVMGGRWERVAACLVGFLLARTVLIRWADPTPSIMPAR